MPVPVQSSSMSRLQNLLTPASVFSREKGRGAIASVFSGSIASGMHFAGMQWLGLGPVGSAVVFLYLFGSVLGYSFDIVFAKERFLLHGQDVVLPYTELSRRARWLVRSFASKKFMRFLIVILIESLIGIAMLRTAIREADRRGWLVGSVWRDAGLAVFVSVFNFFLFSNVLRFDWAYQDGEQPMMNLVVLMWASIVLMMFAVTYSPSRDDPPPPHGTPASARL